MGFRFYDNEKLIEARKLRQLSPREVAEELGVSHMLVTRAEAGKDVSLRAIAVLCKYYAIPLDSIIEPHPDLTLAS